MQRKSLALLRGGVLAVMVRGQGLQGEVVAILGQAWCCRIPAHVEGFATPKTPLIESSLLLEGLDKGAAGTHLAAVPGSNCAFLGDKH